MLLQETTALKKTPLYDRHVSLSGKMVNFNGWSLPVYYRGIIEEHQAVRRHSGFFDVSHLGEIQVKGPGAFQFLQSRLTNDLNKVADGRMLYSLLCDEKGGLLDDILIYRQTRDDYYLIVNAGNIESDMASFLKYAPDTVTLTNRSDETACIAIQGPQSEEILGQCFGFKLQDLPYYAFREEQFSNEPVWVSRSGYTGEDGFEIFSSNALSLSLWDRLADQGQALGAVPAGLGARNTLRLEAGNALYGHELDPKTTPLEAGLQWAVSFNKGGFVGRDAMVSQKDRGLSRHLIGFKMRDKSIAREHYAIYEAGQSGNEKRIGEVTSGSFGPSVGANIGLGFVTKGYEAQGTVIAIEVHGRRSEAEVVSRPFVALKHRNKNNQKG